MAGVQFKGGKHKGAVQAKAMFRHNKQDERLETNHTNPDIDKTKTEFNISYYGLSYREICDKYDKRISELDSVTNRNKRKDRVTMQSIIVTAPKGMGLNQCNAWFRDVAQVVIEQYGEENFLDMDNHFDEIHTYYDADRKEYVESRPHAHICLVPEVDGQLNGKVFSSRQNIMRFNDEIQKMTMEKYGLAFMDGSKKKGKASVEELKQRSDNAEYQRQLEKDYEICEEALRQSYNRREADLTKRAEELQVREQNVSEREIRLSKREKSVDKQVEQVNEQIRQANEDIRKQYEALKAQKQAQENAIRQRAIELQEISKKLVERESRLSQREASCDYRWDSMIQREQENERLIELGRKADRDAKVKQAERISGSVKQQPESQYGFQDYPWE